MAKSKLLETSTNCSKQLSKIIVLKLGPSPLLLGPPRLLLGPSVDALVPRVLGTGLGCGPLPHDGAASGTFVAVLARIEFDRHGTTEVFRIGSVEVGLR